MKLENEIAAVNAVLKTGLGALNYHLGGLVLPMEVQDAQDGGKTRVQNIFAADATPASPDDQYDLDIFHLIQVQQFDPPAFVRGRVSEQKQRTRLVLIAYTDRAQGIDYLLHKLATVKGVELQQVEHAPDLVNRKYLFLEKQPNATAPRQLVAITYLLASDTPLGGDRCPTFEL
jgi:hypothetical protein